MLVLALIPVAAVLGLVAFHFFKTRSRLYRTVEKYYNGPKPRPFLGNALEFPIGSAFGFYQKLLQYASENEKAFRVWLGTDAFIVTHDAKYTEAILSSSTHITKSDVYRFTIPWIGFGLLTSTGAKWKSRRRIITPTFHFKILEDFIDVFEANGKTLVEKLADYAGKPSFNIYPSCNLYALDNICDTAMGVQINAQKDSNSTYVRAVKDMCSVVNLRAFQPWLMPDVLFNLSKYGAIQKNALSILHTHTIETIQQRREELKKKKATQTKTVVDDGLNQKKRQALLDVLLEASEESNLTDEDIREEVDTFMFEGHDTVTSGISFTFYALSQNPEIQEKVYQEQLQVLGDVKKVATYKDYQDMKYLDLVLKEAQRLYPSVPIVGRVMHEDLKLDDGLVLPKGAQAMIMISALHRNPKIWANPDKFDPDNFLPENTSKRNPYAHVPFSAGPRNCIGQRFAILEMKACVSKVVRNYKLLPCKPGEEPRLVSEMVLVSENGVNVRLEKRS